MRINGLVEKPLHCGGWLRSMILPCTPRCEVGTISTPARRTGLFAKHAGGVPPRPAPPQAMPLRFQIGGVGTVAPEFEPG